MTSQPGNQATAIHMLFNITKSNGNQTLKFVQLIECNIRTIFLEKTYTKCDEGTIPRPFSKKSNLSISVDQYSNVLHSLLLLYAEFRAIEIY